MKSGGVVVPLRVVLEVHGDVTTELADQFKTQPHNPLGSMKVAVGVSRKGRHVRNPRETACTRASSAPWRRGHNLDPAQGALGVEPWLDMIPPTCCHCRTH